MLYSLKSFPTLINVQNVSCQFLIKFKNLSDNWHQSFFPQKERKSSERGACTHARLLQSELFGARAIRCVCLLLHRAKRQLVAWQGNYSVLGVLWGPPVNDACFQMFPSECFNFRKQNSASHTCAYCSLCRPTVAAVGDSWLLCMKWFYRGWQL